MNSFEFVTLLNIPKITTAKVLGGKLVLIFEEIIWQCELEVIQIHIHFHWDLFLLGSYSKKIIQKKENKEGDYFYYLYLRIKKPGSSDSNLFLCFIEL